MHSSPPRCSARRAAKNTPRSCRSTRPRSTSCPAAAAARTLSGGAVTARRSTPRRSPPRRRPRPPPRCPTPRPTARLRPSSRSTAAGSR
ncbi:hypothetical protein VHUM_02853 [Vanrija humicola]|uniref:Uncharacterized protein n=1 Tax=Vanrija humicola TaxID=5417 RepID=A0A7D8Z7Q3_VANHU|nr:hypothetical protein VHUM_02853 [Vanrija humicola]